jgi:hypothetical protein
MSFNKRVAASLALSLAICTGSAHAADEGVITKPSKYSVQETVARFEAAVRQKEAAGFTVFTEIDHAATAKKFGLENAAAYADPVRQSEGWNAFRNQDATIGDRFAAQGAGLGGPSGQGLAVV